MDPQKELFIYSVNKYWLIAYWMPGTLCKTQNTLNFLQELYSFKGDKHAQWDKHGMHCNFSLAKKFLQKKHLEMNSRETWLSTAKSCGRCGKQMTWDNGARRRLQLGRWKKVVSSNWPFPVTVCLTSDTRSLVQILNSYTLEKRKLEGPAIVFLLTLTEQ